MVPVPLAAPGSWAAREAGTVQEAEAAAPEAMVPEAEPKKYCRVWVKASEARGRLMEMALPITWEAGLRTGAVARAIFGSVPEPEPSTVRTSLPVQ